MRGSAGQRRPGKRRGGSPYLSQARPSPFVDPRERLPPGVRPVWHAGLAARRVIQLWGQIMSPRSDLGMPGRRRQTKPDAWCRELLARCAIERDVNRNGWVTPCPTCHALVNRLELVGIEWKCLRCHTSAGSGLMLYVSEYAFALRIGLVTLRLNERRHRIAKQLRELAQRVREPGDVVELAIGSAVLGINPMRQRPYKRPKGLPKIGKRPRSIFWRKLGPVYAEAFVDDVLHPDAYRVRLLRS